MSLSDSIFLILLVLLCVFMLLLVALCLGYALWAEWRFDKGIGEQIDIGDERHYEHMPCASKCSTERGAVQPCCRNR